MSNELKLILYKSFEEYYSSGMDESEILLLLKKKFPGIVNDESIKKVNSECEDGESKISMAGLVPGLYVNMGHGKCLSVQDLVNMKLYPESFLNSDRQMINPFTKKVLTPEILKQFDELLESADLGNEPYFSIDTKIIKLREKVLSSKWDLRKTIRSLKRYVSDLQEDPDQIPLTGKDVLLTDYIEDEIFIETRTKIL